MRKGNIIGEEVEDYVNNQINFRQSLQGAGSIFNDNSVQRSNKVLTYLNTRNTWVKLASGISVGNEAKKRLREIIESDGYVGSGVIDENNNSTFTTSDIDNLMNKALAENFVLFNTTQKIQDVDGETSYTPRSGVLNSQNFFSSFNKMYGGMGYKQQGLQPVPGILDVQVDCINRGSIKKATVTLKAFNKFQFSIIELLYLRLGYVMLLEYGWDKYVDNINFSTTPPEVDIKNIGQTIIEETWFKREKPGKSIRDIVNEIESKRVEYQGNYDGFIGKVTNFDWTLNSDLTYDITINLITMGSVITSLSANPPGTSNTFKLKSLQTKILQASSEFGSYFLASDPGREFVDPISKRNRDIAKGEKNVPPVALPNLGGDAISLYLANTIINFDSLNGNDPKGDFFSFTSVLPKPEGIQVPFQDVLDDDPAFSPYTGERGTETEVKYDYLNYLNLQKLDGKYFIRFGRFLRDFFDIVAKQTKYGGSSKTEPELEFIEDKENTICNYELDLIPLDPTVCFFTPTFSIELYNYVFGTNISVTTNGVKSGTFTNESFDFDGNINSNQTSTSIKSLPDYAKESYNGKYMVHGKLMNLYLSVDFLQNQIQSNLDVEDNISVFTYLQNICDGINRAMAGVTAIEPVIIKDTQVTFIEQNLPQGYNGVLKAIKPKTEEQKPSFAEFELVGYNPTNGSSNFVKDFNFITKITPQLANQISIGAAAVDSGTRSISALPLSAWNKGLTNRYQEEFEEFDIEPIILPTPSDKDLKELWLKYGSVQSAFAGSQKTNPAKVTFNYSEGGVEFRNKDFGTPSSLLGKSSYASYRIQDDVLKKYATDNSLEYGGKFNSSNNNTTILNYFWDNQPAIKDYISRAYNQINNGYGNGHNVNTEEGEAASDYISYLAQCFGGNRINFIKDENALTYSREVVPINQAQYYKQDSAFINLGKSLYKKFKHAVNKKLYREEDVVSMTNGFIPLQLQLTCEGLAGIKIYQKMNVDARFLPPNYPDALKFIIQKVNHKISNNIWETSLDTLSIPASTKTRPPSFSIIGPADYSGIETISPNEISTLPDPTLTAILSGGSDTVYAVTGVHSPTISTINPNNPQTGLIYVPTGAPASEKNMIVLHYTATGGYYKKNGKARTKSSKVEMEGIFSSWRGKDSPTTWATSAQFTIDREGGYVQCCALDGPWCWHASASPVNQRTIGYELCNLGYLKKSTSEAKGSKVVKYIQSGTYEVKPQNVAVPYEIVVSEYGTLEPVGAMGSKEFVPGWEIKRLDKYRGYSYYEKHPTAQLRTLQSQLIQFRDGTFPGGQDIPKINPLGNTIFGTNPKNALAPLKQLRPGANGTMFKKDKSKPGEGVKNLVFRCRNRGDAKKMVKWFQRSWPLERKKGEGASSGMGSGVFSHNTFSTGKNDMMPQKEILIMLYAIATHSSYTLPTDTESVITLGIDGAKAV